MASLLVRHLPASTMAALKRRASQHRRSVQQEVTAILERAAGEPGPEDAVRLAAVLRKRLSKSGRVFRDSTPLVREDRAR